MASIKERIRTITRLYAEELEITFDGERFGLIHRRGGKRPIVSVWNEREAKEIADFVYSHIGEQKGG